VGGPCDNKLNDDKPDDNYDNAHDSNDHDNVVHAGDERVEMVDMAD
jgi:hypothetical protein